MSEPGRVGPPRGRLSGLRVLVAEDSWVIAETLTKWLDFDGARVVGPCASCADAFEAVRTQQIDAAVIDMKLDDSFADQLLEQLLIRNIPYIIVTGYGALPTNADERAAAVLGKPIDRERLITLLEEYVVL